ncbi:MAG: DUF882 domain-containing protein [Spirochaetes bacterium]|nr:DUF882 domain-containing protein [Spirochaetota bacterium]
MKLSKHFTDVEFRCRCGCGQMIVNPKLLHKLEELRERINKPIIIHCVNRCIEHNAAVGGVGNSYHISGKAADFHIKGLPMKNLHALILNSDDIFDGGIGVYDWGCHVDVGEKRVWDKRNE